MTQPPHDQPVMVRTREEGLWLPVRWDGARFAVIDGDGSWVEPDEIEDWQPALDLPSSAAEPVAA